MENGVEGLAKKTEKVVVFRPRDHAVILHS